MNKQHDVYSAGYKTGVEPTFFAKVMTFFALAILTSAAGAYVTVTYFMHVFAQNPGLMWGLFIVELALIFTSRMWSTKTPINRFLFAAFAFITGVTIAPLVGVLAQSAAGIAILTKALLATGLMFTATAIIGWTAKVDFSGMRGFLFMGLIGMIITGIIGFFIPWSNTMEMVYSGIGILLFSAFTVYDFQQIKRYPEDRYIDAALHIYLDIFNLFLFILRFTSGGRD
jgi:modulator of FtsH protease